MTGTSASRPPRLERVARGLARAGGAALLVMAFVITVEALLRKFSPVTIGGVDEITAYVFAAATTWAFGWAVIERANVRIDLVHRRLGMRTRVALDLLAVVATLAVFGLIAWRAVELAVQSGLEGARAITPMRTLLVVPQAAWAAGLVFMTLVLLVVLVRALRLLAKGDRAAADRLVGMPDAVEQEVGRQ